MSHYYAIISCTLVKLKNDMQWEGVSIGSASEIFTAFPELGFPFDITLGGAIRLVARSANEVPAGNRRELINALLDFTMPHSSSRTLIRCTQCP